MDKISNYTSMVLHLERQELESSKTGSASPQIYGQLLAIYLLINDLPNAKLLWKRIPKDIKESNSEIQAVWDVGIKISLRQFSSIYSLIDQTQWPSHLNNIMNCIKESTRDRLLTLISKAYTSYEFKDLVLCLGLSETETMEKISKLGWTYEHDNGFVVPTKQDSSNDDAPVPSFDQLMTKLTEYVSFLEN
ncbi:COP9 signalosome complex subunit 8 [Blomia tropicalis]|nr:COP9 signalosome complex subunit 8 [Blomia tropicalis]